MGMCFSKQIKAKSPFHTGAISSQNVSENGTELSNPSSKDSSASISLTPWREGVISSKNVSGNGTELSNPISRASSASTPQIRSSEGVISSKNVSGNGTELSNPISRASSASTPQIRSSEGAISSKNVSGNGTEVSKPSSKASSASIPQIPWSEGAILQSSDLTRFKFSDHITSSFIPLPISSGVISSECVHGKGSELSNSSKKAASTSVPPIPRSEVEILQASNLKSFTFSDLTAATRKFCRGGVLGEGGFGCVYKGWVDEHSLAASKPGIGMVIAVKVLSREGWQGHKEWLAEINYLGQLHHPNLVNLIGYCLEDDHRLLVYEFMPNGSMDSHLFRRRSSFQPLSWNLRMKIALGAARGLAFLHNAERKVIYRDFKTNNILLDSNYNAKLSDLGLARDGPIGDKSHVSTQVMGTFGYTAPENRNTDPCLEGHYSTGQAIKAATLAFQCLSAEPSFRPNMDKVVTALEQIQKSKQTSKNDQKDHQSNRLIQTHRGRRSCRSSAEETREVMAYPRTSASPLYP